MVWRVRSGELGGEEEVKVIMAGDFDTLDDGH